MRVDKGRAPSVESRFREIVLGRDSSATARSAARGQQSARNALSPVLAVLVGEDSVSPETVQTSNNSTNPEVRSHISFPVQGQYLMNSLQEDV